MTSTVSEEKTRRAILIDDFDRHARRLEALSFCVYASLSHHNYPEETDVRDRQKVLVAISKTRMVRKGSRRKKKNFLPRNFREQMVWEATEQVRSCIDSTEGNE